MEIKLRKARNYLITNDYLLPHHKLYTSKRYNKQIYYIYINNTDQSEIDKCQGLVLTSLEEKNLNYILYY